MSLQEGIKTNYSLFGPWGLWLVGKARLTRRPIQVKVEVHGIKHPLYLRLRTTDVALVRDILVNVSEYACDFPKVPRVIIDAGANIGLTSIFYANRYPDAKIVAIEPDPSNYEMLVKNTLPYSNVSTVRGALWKENADVTLMDSGSGSWGFQIQDKPNNDSRNIQGVVRGITIDKVMAENQIDHIDVLKIDIEGAEREVFESSDNWINKVGAIVIELHDHLKAGCGKSVHCAAKDFDVEWRKGETTFLMRGPGPSSGAPHTSEIDEAPHTSLCQGVRRRHVKILSVE